MPRVCDMELMTRDHLRYKIQHVYTSFGMYCFNCYYFFATCLLEIIEKKKRNEMKHTVSCRC